MIVNGPKLHKDFTDDSTDSNSSDSSIKCQKQLEAVRKKKKIDLSAIGSRPNNLLLEFLKCHTKANHKNISASTGIESASCKAAEKSYASCHASVMGTGNFNGKKNCGDELQRWLDCCRGRGKAPND